MIRTELIPQVVAVGSAGSGVGTKVSTQPINGLLLAIGVEQGNTPHANTVITISVEYSGKSRTLLTLTGYSTTALTWKDVRELLDDTVGASIASNYSVLPLGGYITVAVTLGGSNATCNVTVVYTD